MPSPRRSVRQVSPAAPARYTQMAFTELGTPLKDVTFVVLDLETTGGAPDGDGITEIGAVKVRGGEQLGGVAPPGKPNSPHPPVLHLPTRLTPAIGAPG